MITILAAYQNSCSRVYYTRSHIVVLVYNFIIFQRRPLLIEYATLFIKYYRILEIEFIFWCPQSKKEMCMRFGSTYFFKSLDVSFTERLLCFCCIRPRTVPYNIVFLICSLFIGHFFENFIFMSSSWGGESYYKTSGIANYRCSICLLEGDVIHLLRKEGPVGLLKYCILYYRR